MKPLLITDVASYCKRRWGLSVYTAVDVTAWLEQEVNPLEYVISNNVRYTTDLWVDEFLLRTGRIPLDNL